jgi:hypothetical protein
MGSLDFGKHLGSRDQRREREERGERKEKEEEREEKKTQAMMRSSGVGN